MIVPIEIPKWLKRLQENSWEAEILISGGAIFSLFQITDGLLALYIYFINLGTFEGVRITFLLALIASKGLTLGFVIHLLVRAYWIALICTNFAIVKTNDREVQTLPLKIISLDKIAGLLFSTSIFFAIFICGVYFLLVPIFLSGPVYGKYLAALGVLWLFDILTKKKIRGTKFITFLRFPFWVVDKVSLSFLYVEPLVSIFKTFGFRKSLFLSIVFSLTTILFSLKNLQAIFHTPDPFDRREFKESLSRDGDFNSYHYQSESDGVFIKPQIQSPLISDDFLRVQIGYIRWDDFAIKDKGSSVYSDIISIQIDDSVIHDVRWKSLYPKVNESTYGIITFINIKSLKIGEHTLTIRKSNPDRLEAIIPFWKE